jgi:hypothetical protein
MQPIANPTTDAMSPQGNVLFKHVRPQAKRVCFGSFSDIRNSQETLADGSPVRFVRPVAGTGLLLPLSFQASLQFLGRFRSLMTCLYYHTDEMECPEVIPRLPQTRLLDPARTGRRTSFHEGGTAPRRLRESLGSYVSGRYRCSWLDNRSASLFGFAPPQSCTTVARSVRSP